MTSGIRVQTHAENEAPPPPKTPGRRGEVSIALRDAADAAPGQWVSVDCGTKTSATNRARALRIWGYEATSRGSVAWARKVVAL